jgi:hypothetical protein
MLLPPSEEFLKQKRFVAEQKEKIAKKSMIMKSFADIKDNRGNCQNEQTEYM